jgi:hypothetical protein
VSPEPTSLTVSPAILNNGATLADLKAKTGKLEQPFRNAARSRNIPTIVPVLLGIAQAEHGLDPNASLSHGVKLGTADRCDGDTLRPDTLEADAADTIDTLIDLGKEHGLDPKSDDPRVIGRLIKAYHHKEAKRDEREPDTYYNDPYVANGLAETGDEMPYPPSTACTSTGEIDLTGKRAKPGKPSALAVWLLTQKTSTPA